MIKVNKRENFDYDVLSREEKVILLGRLIKDLSLEIGLKRVEDGYIITDMESKELSLTTSEEARIKALLIVKEKLE